MAKKIKVIQVCLTHNLKCNNLQFPVKVKNEIKYFCCGKGFERHLEDFRKSVKQKQPNEVER